MLSLHGLGNSSELLEWVLQHRLIVFTLDISIFKKAAIRIKEPKRQTSRVNKPKKIPWRATVRSSESQKGLQEQIFEPLGWKFRNFCEPVYPSSSKLLNFLLFSKL